MYYGDTCKFFPDFVSGSNDVHLLKRFKFSKLFDKVHL